ncbi:MAG: ATP-binding protein [Methyloceanibacter sp.]|jgi:two-component system sensor histidine kinase CpxA
MSFFWRIFLSAWAIILITITVTRWAGSWLPDREHASNDARLERMVSIVAQELREQLAIDPTTVANVLVEEHVLDLLPVLEIFVLKPSGDDVLGRSLPEPVSQAYNARDDLQARSAEDSSRLHVRNNDLDGYMVVGYAPHFPLREVLMRPGGRGLLAAFLVTVSAIVSFMLARFIVLPVRRLRLAEQEVASGDLSVRVAHTVGNRTDDIARLAQDFDVMAEQVDTLLQSQRRLMRDVSHELRSPLARLHALLSIAHQTADSTGAAQIERMETELERLDDLIGEILAFVKLESHAGIQRHPTDIVDLIQNIVDDASLEAQTDAKQIRIEGFDRCVIEVDSSMIQSAIENVVRNALKYTAEGTAVELSVAAEAGCLRIVIDDSGPGVPEDEIDKIFQPFYRVEGSKSTRSGSGGIGLAIAERSVRLHGGTIKAKNRAGGGLSVEISLPHVSSVSG